LKVHEFQAKQLLQDYGVPVPRGRVARSPEEAEDIARELGVPVAVKAQIHAGGRGKAGGIKLAATPEEARQAAAQILGRVLVTHQTGPEGRLVRSVLVEEAVRPARELYLAVVIENALGMPVLMASDAGGVDIEEVAATSPERIHRLPVDPAIGFQPFMGRELGMAIGLTGDLLKQGVQAMGGLYRLFMDKDCSLVEVNPLVVTDDGRLLAADAKVNFDDNALFRHPTCRPCATPTRGPCRATSAAWSTGPDWPWRRWMPSSWRAGSQPTSWTSAPSTTWSGWSTPSAFSPPTSRCGPS